MRASYGEVVLPPSKPEAFFQASDSSVKALAVSARRIGFAELSYNNPWSGPVELAS
jgi:hypothetical protein